MVQLLRFYYVDSTVAVPHTRSLCDNKSLCSEVVTSLTGRLLHAVYVEYQAITNGRQSISRSCSKSAQCYGPVRLLLREVHVMSYPIRTFDH